MSAEKFLRARASSNDPLGTLKTQTCRTNELARPARAGETGSQIVASHETQLIDAGICHLVLIDPRALVREALVLAIRATTQTHISSYATAEQWQEASGNIAPGAILLGLPGKPRDPESQRQLAITLHCSKEVPVIVMAGAEEPDQIIETLERGARGYVPTSLPLTVAVLALRMVAEGGVFIPASSLLIARRQLGQNRGVNSRGEPELFTGRQIAVVEALSRGKANKVIAYELNMCESTVKVHVRNIMKKLKAKNRTEVAFIANSLLQSATRKDPGSTPDPGWTASHREDPAPEIVLPRDSERRI